MHIEFVRTGGFAGLSLTAKLDLRDLSTAESETLERQINQSNFFDLPEQIKPAAPVPDGFEYQLMISSADGTHTVTVSESLIPVTLRPLLDHLTALARTGKYH